MNHTVLLTTLCSTLVLASCTDDTAKSNIIDSDTNSTSASSNLLNQNNPITNNMVLLSGKVADGYLVGAKVCLDKNLNDQCDPDEPSAISTEGGNFQFDVNQNEKNKYPIVAEVSEHTVDEDTQMAVGDAYTLTAPVTNNDEKPFVSPLSHMIHQSMKQDSSLNLEEVKQIISDKLNVSVDDITGDFIQRSKEHTNIEKREQAKKLHNHARRIARALAAATKETKELSNALPPEEQKEIPALIMSTVDSILPSILETPIEENNKAIDFKKLNTSIAKVMNSKAMLPKNIEQLKASIKTRKDRHFAKPINVNDLLAEGVVTSTLTMDYGKKDLYSGESKGAKFALNSEEMRLNKQTSLISNKKSTFNFSDLSLVSSIESNASNIYSEETNSWIYYSDLASCSLTDANNDSEKESLISCASKAENLSLRATSIDISGRFIPQVVYRNFNPLKLSFVKFPEGSKLLHLKMKRLNNTLISPIYSTSDTCSNELYGNYGDNCNLVMMSSNETTPAQSLDEVISPAEQATFNIQLPVGVQLSLLDNQQIVLEKEMGREGTTKQITVGRWNKVEYKGMEAYKLSLPPYYLQNLTQNKFDRLISNLYIVKTERAIRLAYEKRAGYLNNKGLVLNTVAFEAFTQAIEGFKNPSINKLIQSMENRDHTEENTANTEENTDHTEGNIANTEENTDHTEGNTANTEENTDHTEGNTANTEENTDHTEGNTANTEENTDHTEENTANTEENTDHTEENRTSETVLTN